MEANFIEYFSEVDIPFMICTPIMILNKLTLTKPFLLSLGLFFLFVEPHMSIAGQDDIKKERRNKMENEVNSWVDKRGLPVDPAVKKAVVGLNLLGFKTINSCEGHLDRGHAFPWIDFDLSVITEQERESAEKSQAISIEYMGLMTTLKERYPHLSQSEISNLDPKSDPIVEELLRKNEEVLLIRKIIYQPRDKWLSPVRDLLARFYEKQHPDYGSILIVDTSGIKPLDSQFQEIRTPADRAIALKKFQAEMEKFGDFLYEYFLE